MDEYKLDMGIRFDPDEQSVKQLDKIAENFKRSFNFRSEDFDSLRKEMSDFEVKRQSIIEAGKMLQTYQTVKGLPEKEDNEYTKQMRDYIRALSKNNEALTRLADQYDKANATDGGEGDEGGDDDDDGNKFLEALAEGLDNFIGNLKMQVLRQLSNIANSFISGIANVFKEAWEELGNMVNQSFLTNDTYRENAFSYGMSASESYGFEQAKSMLGVNDETMIYMDDYQWGKFRDIMTKYTERYEKLYDSGFFEDYLDFQIEMQEFKQDMEMEIIEFFMDNKDTIKDFMELTMDAMEFIVDALGWIMDFLDPDDRTSDEEKIDNINGILDQYVSNNNVTNNTVNMDGNYTFNGTTDSQKEFYTDMLKSSMVEAKKAFE